MIPPRLRPLLLAPLFTLVIAHFTTDASAQTYQAKQTVAPPIIDGVVNETVWTAAGNATVSKLVLGSSPNNTVTFSALWDASYLYVAIRVTDANLYNDSADVWLDDGIEIYIDANHNHGTSYDSSDRQFTLGHGDGTAFGERNGNVSGVIAATAAAAGGFTAEFRIPWANLGISALSGISIGFDIGNNDDDNGGATRERQVVWNGTSNNYTNTSAFGDLTLSATTIGDATDPVVTITAPTRNQNVSGASVSIAATATDASGIAQVDFFNGATPISTDNSSPYTATLNTTARANGVHTITAAATDNTVPGNLGDAAVDVIVNNLPATYLANRRVSAITIDGQLNGEWSASLTASTLVLGSSPNNTVTFGALWDDTYLYVGVRVLDASLDNASTNHWDDDSVEVYIDGNHNGRRVSTYELTGGANNLGYDRQFVKCWNDSALYAPAGHSKTGVLHAWAAITGGYSVEIAIPWSNLNLRPTVGMTIGFDIGNNDDDTTFGVRDRQVMWNGTSSNSVNTSAFGTLRLIAPGHVIPPEGGATQTWAYYEAEAGTTNGTLLTGAAWVDGDVAFEARGKKCVSLGSNSQYVEWTNVQAPGGAPATHAIVRYSIADAQTGTLGLYVNGDLRTSFTLNSLRLRESKAAGSNPTTVRLFDDALVAVPGGIPPGATVRVKKETGDAVAYLIDFLEVETAPAAKSVPDGTWVVVAAPTGNSTTDRASIVNAITTADAGNKKVWIPAGTYAVGTQILVPAGIEIRGAGMWHTQIDWLNVNTGTCLFRLGDNCTVADFKCVGTNMVERKSGNGVIRLLDVSDCVVEGIWTEYGSLVVGHGDNAAIGNHLIRGNRVRNGYADAIHIARVAVGNLIENNTIRNAGDDSIAFVPYDDAGMVDNTARYNTVECNYWGRGITILGGDGNRAEFNVARNIINSGVMAGLEIYDGKATLYCKNWVIENNTVIACGNNRNAVYGPAVSLWTNSTLDNPMFGRMENNRVIAPPFHGAKLSQHLGDAGTSEVVTFINNTIEAPTSAGSWQRLVLNLATTPTPNCVSTPNSFP